MIEPDSVKRSIRDYWDSRSNYYDSIPRISREEEIAWLEEFRNTFGVTGKRILDVGTGTGFSALLLAELGHQVTGIDLSDKMLVRAEEKARQLNLKVNFEKGDAETLYYEDEAFDGIVCRYLFWTLPHPEKALEEWIRVTRNNGTVVIIDGIWSTGVLGRVSWMWHRVIKENANPKNCRYPHEVKNYLPHANGVEGRKIASMLSTFGLKEIKIRELKHIREIRKKNLPLHLRPSRSFPIYMVSGTVKR